MKIVKNGLLFSLFKKGTRSKASEVFEIVYKMRLIVIPIIKCQLVQVYIVKCLFKVNNVLKPDNTRIFLRRKANILKKDPFELFYSKAYFICQRVGFNLPFIVFNDFYS